MIFCRIFLTQKKQGAADEDAKKPQNAEGFKNYFQFAVDGSGSMLARVLSDRGRWSKPAMTYVKKQARKQARSKCALDAQAQAFMAAMHGAQRAGRLGQWSAEPGFGLKDGFSIVGGSWHMYGHSKSECSLLVKQGQTAYERARSDINHELSSPAIQAVASIAKSRATSTPETRARALGDAVVLLVSSRAAPAAGCGACTHGSGALPSEPRDEDLKRWEEWWAANRNGAIDVYNMQ